VGFVTIGTIALWCVAQQDAVRDFFGDMGVIALLPVVLFFGTGILKKVLSIVFLLAHLVTLGF
jgi:di/tricarboxylate transporter